MRQKLLLYCSIFTCLIFVPTTASAQPPVLISLDVAGNSNVDLGTPGTIEVLNFFISRPAGSGASAISAASPNYTLDAGSISDPPGSIAPAGTGADSGSGLFGDGNLITGDPIRRDAATMFGINQEFSNPETLTSVPQLWFSLDIDTTGLADGDYAITMTNSDQALFLLDGGLTVLTPNNDLTFTVNSAAVLLGDVNLDGTVNFLDISPFILVLSGATFQAEADCDESGVVNFLDIASFIAILSGS